MSGNNHFISILLALCIATAVLAACATAPKTFNPDDTGPQVLVKPHSASLGVANLMKTPIVFTGCNFPPGDSVIIKILDVEKEGRTVDIPIADAFIDDQGNFGAELSSLSKITDFLRADTELNENMEPVLIVVRPTIPAGDYQIQAECMQSDQKARTHLTLKRPSVGDKVKDWIGRVFLKKIKKG